MTNNISRSLSRSRQRLIRQAENMLARQQRLLNRRLHRLHRQLTDWRYRQYFVGRAMRDLLPAISNNEDIFIGCAIGAVLIGYAFAAAASELLFFSFQSLNALSDMTGFNMGAISVVGLGALVTLGSWILVLITNSLDIAILDGAFRKRNTSLRRTARQALALTPRVSIAWLLTWIIASVSLLIVAVPFLLYILAHRHAPLTSGFVLLAIAVGLTTIYFISGFLLGPSIALYESQRKLLSSVKRSYQLCKPSGRLAITSLTLLLGASLSGAWILSDWLQATLHYTGDIVFYLLAVAELIIANLLLTMIYRKRRIARPIVKQSVRLYWRRMPNNISANS